MERNCILLDTSFLIRLLNDQDPLHHNAKGYFKYFLEKNYPLKISTISIAEYCVKGEIDELPLSQVQVLPFNIQHAVKAGKMAALAFQNRDILGVSDRKIIPNDTKLFAQADSEASIFQFATSDEECLKIYRFLNDQASLQFEIINIKVPHHERFGMLDL